MVASNIISLYPFSQNSKRDEVTGESVEYIEHERIVVNWHLVIGNKWIDLGIKLPKWMEFHIGFADGVGSILCVKRCFGFDLEEDEFDAFVTPYKYHFIRLPWHLEPFKKEILLGGKWVLGEPLSCLGYTQKVNLVQDTKVYKFKAYNKSILATVKAYRFLDAIYWFPTWLKECFNIKREMIDISFSDEIGKGRGSWKGGITGLCADYKNSLRDSWYAFKNGELKSILGEK